MESKDPEMNVVKQEERRSNLAAFVSLAISIPGLVGT